MSNTVSGGGWDDNGWEDDAQSPPAPKVAIKAPVSNNKDKGTLVFFLNCISLL